MLREYRYAYGAVESLSGESFFLVMPQCNTVCMNIFLKELSSKYADDIILLCCDGAAWHKTKIAKYTPKYNFVFIPPYTPEMYLIEQI